MNNEDDDKSKPIEASGARQPPPSRYIQTTEEDKSSPFEVCAVCFCWFFVVLFFPFSLCCCVIVVPEYTRLIILRLGRLRKGAKGPGLVLNLPCIDDIHRVDMRTDVYNIWPQDVLTKDSVTITVNAVIYYCIYDAIDSIIQVDDVYEATLMMAKVTLRNIVGSKMLNVLLTSRQTLSLEIQQAVAGITARWGVRVERVDVMDIILPSGMERSLASEAEAVREARAKIILAEGELKASKALKEASDVMAQNKITLQLRHLQILSSIASERRVRIIYPIPMEIMEPFMDDKKKGGETGGSGGANDGGDKAKPSGKDAAKPTSSNEPPPSETVVPGPSGTVEPSPSGTADPGPSGTAVPGPPITRAFFQETPFISVDMVPISAAANLRQWDASVERNRTRTTRRGPPAPVGRLTLMDLQSYRDFLRGRW